MTDDLRPPARARPASPRRRHAVAPAARAAAAPGKLVYLALLAVAFFSAFPLYCRSSSPRRTTASSARCRRRCCPGGNLVENIERAFGTVPFARALINSFLVAGTITLSVVFFSTLAGFAFAKLQLPRPAGAAAHDHRHHDGARPSSASSRSTC